MEIILHIINYAASYSGNFMASMFNLEEKLNKQNKKILYLFVPEVEKNAAALWINQMREEGRMVEVLSGIPKKDIRMIKKLLKKYPILAIHTHFITRSLYLTVYLASMFSKVPVILHMHNHSQKIEGVFKNMLRHRLYKKCIMVACSQSVMQSLERDYPKNKKYVIENGVNFARLDSYEKVEKKEFGIPEDEKVLLIFGFDFYRKGVDLAIKATEMLRKEGKAFTLLISLSTNFEKVNEKIKTLLGAMPAWIKIVPARNDVATLYNFADVFLSPSREEGLPYSVIEAGYAECGVVLSDISAQRNMKIPYACWHKKENAEDLSKKIMEALHNQEEKKKNLENVRKELQESYTLDRWSQNMLCLYEDVLGE